MRNGDFLVLPENMRWRGGLVEGLCDINWWKVWEGWQVKDWVVREGRGEG